VQTLPSGRDSGLVLAPFRGVRYDPDRVSGIANVTSPPYDVIGSGTLDELLAAEPHNIVRLILPGFGLDAGADAAAPASAEAFSPAGPAGPGTANARAATRLHDWLASGVLSPDPEPALYIYEQRGAGWLQRGLIGLVAVGTPDSAGVLPHEGVMPGPVTGRRQLMMATRANLEPIFLVYNGGVGRADSPGSLGGSTPGSGGHRGPAGPFSAVSGSVTASGLVRLAAEEREPLFTAVTDDGVTHRLWRLADPADHATVAADLAGRTALIADGHHRYAAYRELRDLMRGGVGSAGPWDYGLAFLVDADAHPPQLGAIHRVIPHLAPEDAARLAAEAFTVEELRHDGDGEVPDGLEAAMGRLAEAGGRGTAFLLAGRSGYRLLTDPDHEQLQAAMPPQASPRWQALDASIMQELLMARLWSIKDNERDVLISHHAGEAVQTALDASGTAVLCNPVPFAAVKEVAEHGERVPRKSTSFGPKPRTGLVLRTWEP
jgi:uncharacterized protein (DUF1015 family)